MKRHLIPALVILTVFLSGVFNASVARAERISPGELQVYEKYLTEQGYSLSCTSGMDQVDLSRDTVLIRLNCINDESKPVVVEITAKGKNVKITRMHPPQKKKEKKSP